MFSEYWPKSLINCPIVSERTNRFIDVLPSHASPNLVSGDCGADCGIDMSGPHRGMNLAGAPLIVQAEEGLAACPIGQQGGIWIKADVDWLALWFN
jgi:hypothetical protein